MDIQDERRRFQRVTNQFNVRIFHETARDVKETSVKIARSINISASGILLAVNGFLEEQKTVRVTFVKPNSIELFEGSARVVRTSKNNDLTFSVALVFTGLSESEVNDLDYQIRMTA